MPSTSTAEIVMAAQRERRAACAFNVVTLEHAEAIIRGAELCRLPVILQISLVPVRI